MRDIYVPPGGPPQTGPSKEIYGIMGQENIERMLEDFYLELGQSNVAHLFPKEEEALKQAGRKSALFFVFLLGGPPLYHQKYGHPRMRARHMPFTIDMDARNTWMSCFRKVLQGASQKYTFPEQHLDGFISFLEDFSLWMVNRKKS